MRCVGGVGQLDAFHINTPSKSFGDDHGCVVVHSNPVATVFFQELNGEGVSGNGVVCHQHLYKGQRICLPYRLHLVDFAIR